MATTSPARPAHRALATRLLGTLAVCAALTAWPPVARDASASVGAAAATALRPTAVPGPSSSAPQPEMPTRIARGGGGGGGGGGHHSTWDSDNYGSGTDKKFDPYGKANPYAIPDPYGKNDPYSLKNYKTKKTGNGGGGGGGGAAYGADGGGRANAKAAARDSMMGGGGKNAKNAKKGKDKDNNDNDYGDKGNRYDSGEERTQRGAASGN